MEWLYYAVLPCVIKFRFNHVAPPRNQKENARKIPTRQIHRLPSHQRMGSLRTLLRHPCPPRLLQQCTPTHIQTCIRTVEASTFPIRTVKFLCNKHWVLTGSDDFQVRVFNYNTMEKVKAFEAHNDFIRSIIVHPSEPLIITSSDDAKIKIWNYETGFTLKRTLDEHKHFVLCLAFNPKDLTKFASGSMDKTVKIWNLGTDGKANLTLSGHKGSVNTIDFYKGDRPHFATGSDDKTIKIWDYQTKQNLATIEEHIAAVTCVFFHPELPILFSTSEDSKTIIHHSHSYKILNTL